MSIKELTRLVEETTGKKVIWELGKKYDALNKETGELVAQYNPKTGQLKIN